MGVPARHEQDGRRCPSRRRPYSVPAIFLDTLLVGYFEAVKQPHHYGVRPAMFRTERTLLTIKTIAACLHAALRTLGKTIASPRLLISYGGK